MYVTPEWYDGVPEDLGIFKVPFISFKNNPLPRNKSVFVYLIVN